MAAATKAVFSDMRAFNKAQNKQIEALEPVINFIPLFASG